MISVSDVVENKNGTSSFILNCVEGHVKTDTLSSSKDKYSYTYTQNLVTVDTTPDKAYESYTYNTANAKFDRITVDKPNVSTYANELSR